jgi:protein-disulfide isomerase
MKEYEGKVRLVVKDFPLAIHDLARPAHVAARCAGAQGRYWEYHDRLFEEQPRFQREALVRYAGDLALDDARFVRCLDDGAQAAAVDADVKEARALGVSGTPTFLVRSTSGSGQAQLLVGAHPVETFREAIADALRER